MRIFEELRYGFFDTRQSFPGKGRTQGRDVELYEIEFYLSSTGKSIVDDRVYDLSEGALLSAKPGQTRKSVLDFQCYYLHIRFPEGSPYPELLRGTPDFYRIIDREVYGKLFEELLHFLVSDGDIYSDYVTARLLELFYYLHRDAQNNRNYLELSRQAQNQYLPRAVEYIREHFQQPLTLSDMARVTGYSPNYFHSIFTSIMGKTPGQYLLDVRVAHAKYLLAQPSKSLSEIAYECGFSSQAYFTEQFKKETFVTPGQYRKRCMAYYRV